MGRNVIPLGRILGIPVGLVLCFVFMLKAYMAIFYSEEGKDEKKEDQTILPKPKAGRDPLLQ